MATVGLQWHRSSPLRLEPLGDALITYDTLRGHTRVLLPLAAAVLEELDVPATIEQLSERLALTELQQPMLDQCLTELERHEMVYRSTS